MSSLWCTSSSFNAACCCTLLVLMLLQSSTCQAVQASAQEVISIGGFVTIGAKLSSAISALNQQDPDLSAVRVQLFNPAGIKVAEGDCSPNGYYFVPIDNAGSYKVRVHGPQGWVFAPQQLSISCDEAACNAGNDVNFEVVGLELSGHIQPGKAASSCKAPAPTSFSGITISAKASGASPRDRPLTTAVTDTTFSLGPLLPGQYSIAASHPDWQLEPGSMSHTLSLDAPQLPGPFTIKGYRLSGTVTSKSGPVAGIQVTLLTKDDEVSVGCSSSHPPGPISVADIDAALSTTPLCSVTTDAAGQYSFGGVPCGQYTLQAAHPDTDNTFEIQPASLTVDVGQGDTAVARDFVVTGFSVSGRVVDESGMGVPSVSIIVNGRERATTDLNGRYVLGRMQEGRTDVSAEKQYFAFSSLSAVSVTPSAQVLPDILVKKVGVCGRLVYGDLTFKQNSKRVTLSSADGGGINEQTTADKYNKWCFLVPPGRYRVAPYVSAEDRARGLVVAPSHVDLVLRGEPVLDLEFGQAKLALHGSVSCLDGPCPEDLMVIVKVASTGSKVMSGKLADIQVKHSGPSDGVTSSFTFNRVRPGRYLVSAEMPGWCWASDSVEVEVKTSDATAPTLTHKGYQLKVTSGQAVDLVIMPADESSPLPAVEAPIKQGTTSICLPGSGSFVMTPRSCYIYPSKSFLVHISAQERPPLQLSATGAYISGQVVVRSPSDAITSSPLPDDVTVTAAPVGGSDSAQGMTATATQINPEQQPGVYSYTLAVDLGTAVVVSAKQPEGSSFIFSPDSVEYRQAAAGHAGCPPPAETIYAYQGVAVTGSTDPPVEGASVKVLFATGSDLAGKPAGDVAAEAATSEDGTFAVGPLFADATYSVELSKRGHVMQLSGEPDGLHFNFVSKQLAQVSVRVDLPPGTDPSAVFLSLSGSSGFKHNARLGSDQGIVFSDLQPGTYYLKPLLREHTFEPPVLDLKLQDGQQLEMGLTAVRTAWGISGAVTSVGGSPLSGAVMEACRADSGVVLDSAVTDEGGHYRVGNLKPGGSYLMRVRLDGRVISAHPAGKKVELGSADVTDINFTAFRTSSRSSLTASLPNNLPAALRAAIKAELLPASTAGAAGANPVGSVAVDASGFFEMRGLKPGAYVLKLSCGPAAAAAAAAGAVAGAAVGALSCEPWETAVQITNKDLHLGVLPFEPISAAASGAATAALAAAGSEPISHEGLDWKMPVIVLVLFIAASATVLQPAVVDILQLKSPVAPPSPAAFMGTDSGNAGGNSRAAANAAVSGSKAAANKAAAAAVAAAAAAAAADVAAAAAAPDLSADEFSDENEDVLEVKPKKAGLRSRSRRA